MPQKGVNSRGVETALARERPVSPGAGAAVEQAPEPVEDSPEERAKANVRATLNMILTVAGEFYGQRDLLEFRDPFGRVLEEGG